MTTRMRLGWHGSQSFISKENQTAFSKRLSRREYRAERQRLVGKVRDLILHRCPDLTHQELSEKLQVGAGTIEQILRDSPTSIPRIERLKSMLTILGDEG